jgi:ribonuclease R
LRGENTKKVYRLGDKVLVQVVRVDMERRQVDFGLVEILEAMRAGERSGRAASAAGSVRSRTKPKAEQRKATRPGRRERMEKKQGRTRSGSR